MAKTVFAVTTPLGYRVTLTRDRWREIVRFKHPALADHENDVRACIEQPDVVRESLKDPSVHLYYKKSGNKYVCGVVGQTDKQAGFVVTAYFTDKIKQGTELWIR